MRPAASAAEAAALLERHCTPEVVRVAELEGWSAELWRELERAGLAAVGIVLPLAEAAEVVRAAAGFAAPIPLAETVLVGWLRGTQAPPGPLTVVHRGRAPYGRVATALLSGDGFVAPEDAHLERAVNPAGEPMDRVGVPDAAGADVLRLGALLRAVQLVGAMERVLELLQQPPARLAGQVASAGTSVDHALDFPGEVEVAAAKIRSGEAAAATEAAAIRDQDLLGPYLRRLRSWRADFGSEAEWARVLGRKVHLDPGLLWGHAPARGTD
ncbi:MAG: hypothetical protein J2P45_05025 [Candidatus Dormibacteraeota bacterium]|nr:hypothetical protein [Candidatus Dormibacteraeota bacterium]